jgi:dihydrofolate synthase / folylpolyglutamate synthase
VSDKLRQALEALYGMERRRAKLGLEGTRALLASLGDPHQEFASVHVGGTNGKGSTCAMIERVLRAAGMRTGLFTSPHLVDFRERIRVNGQWADEKRLERRLELIRKLPGSGERTFFEVCTALAFDHFASQGVEWAVVEVGLGGRLDSTNVLTPELTAITSIALDHTEILGDTIEAVASEKAGIIKESIPIVSGVGELAAARAIERMAKHRDAPLVRAARLAKVKEVASGPEGLRFSADLPPWGELELSMPLRGRHQLANASVALAALSCLEDSGVTLPSEAVEEGFAKLRWPGRLEPCPDEPRLWWDGAHNADGIATLAHAWSEDLGFDPPGAIVLALSRDKDAAAIVGTLHAFAPDCRLILTRAASERALPVEDLVALAEAAGAKAVAAPTVAKAARAALAATSGHVLLTGSLFAVGEAMQALGGAPGPSL